MQENFQHQTDMLIVGTGMAGLTAATALQATGREVLVIDKGREVGRRLASRRLGAATLDYGAQLEGAALSGWAAADALNDLIPFLGKL